jgi:hypothetical protein
VPDPGFVWSALTDMHGETSLVPLVVNDDDDMDEDLFTGPSDAAEIDRLDIAELLAARWQDDPFPGLAPATDGGLSSSVRTAALRSLRPARIGLVAARRPADVLPAVGWTCFDDPAYDDGIRNAVWIGAVLRSWEKRFGARLLAIGPGAQVRLLVSRPPQTLDAAEKIAAEHSAFCDECAGQGLRTVREIAPVLVDAPIWTFWWD